MLRFLFLFFAFFCSGAALAQSNRTYQLPLMDQSAGPEAAAYYNMLARQALSSKPDDFNFTAFRSRYAHTPHYDPVGEASRAALLSLAERVQKEKDPEKSVVAAAQYSEFLAAHLANIDVVTQALILAQQNSEYGNAGFLEWMRRGLLENIVHAGTGRSAANAYDIVTLGEETAVLNNLGLQPVSIDHIHADGLYYNIYEIPGATPDSTYPIFMNVTLPMTFLERQKREGRFLLDIGRQ